MNTNIEILIDLVPLSPNRLLRMHWRERAKYNKEMLQAVWVAKHQAGVIGRPVHAPVKLAIEVRICGQKDMDPDNLVGSCKAIIDALVQLGIIRDDDPESVAGLTVTQKRMPRSWAGALIQIELLSGNGR